MTLDQNIEKARRARLWKGLQNLASWCQIRASGDHNLETTLTMLERKACELRGAVDRAGWAVSNSDAAP